MKIVRVLLVSAFLTIMLLGAYNELTGHGYAGLMPDSMWKWN